MHRKTEIAIDRVYCMLHSALSAWRVALLLVCLLSFSVSLAMPARGEAQMGVPDVLPGAFGESIDSLDSDTREACLDCADLALNRLLTDYFESTPHNLPDDRYLQILQTTLLLPGTQPTGLTDVERAIWAETYADAAGVVSFVALTNSLNLNDVPYAEISDSFDYVVKRDGTADRISLRAGRSRYFTDMIVPSVRVINMGGHYNAVYSPPSTANSTTVPLHEYLNNPEITAFVENFEMDFPASVCVRHDGEISGEPFASNDPDTIRAVFEALLGITVFQESSAGGHTDDYLNYYFEMADGKMIYGWTFQSGMLLDDEMGLHEITGFEALQRALPDPWS